MFRSSFGLHRSRTISEAERKSELEKEIALERPDERTVINLHHREANLEHGLIAAFLFGFDLVEQILADSRHNAFVLCVPNYGIRFSAARLTVGEQTGVVSVEGILCSKTVLVVLLFLISLI